MKSFLKRLESENFRLRFLNFSEIDSWSALDNYTRIKSFIVNDVFEIACSKWYKMYIQIVESLQEIRPLTLNYLLQISPFNGRCTPFLDHRAAGYQETSFGIYLRVPTAANDIIFSIKKMLRVYGFSPRDSYLIMELNPEAVSYYSDDIIKQEREDLLAFLRATYVRADDYYQTVINAIGALNIAIQNSTNTTYNNLYLLSESDYNRYSKIAITRQLLLPNNKYSSRELELAVRWLYYSRFCEGDYLYIKPKNKGDSFIKSNGRIIQITFNSHFYD